MSDQPVSEVRGDGARALVEKIEIGLARSVTADNMNYTAVCLTVAEAQQALKFLERLAFLEERYEAPCSCKTDKRNPDCEAHGTQVPR